MEEQDNSVNSIGINVESKEGEHRLLSCNNANGCSPFLVYEQLSASSNLGKAFDLLFEEVMRSKNKKQ